MEEEKEEWSIVDVKCNSAINLCSVWFGGTKNGTYKEVRIDIPYNKVPGFSAREKTRNLTEMFEEARAWF